MTITHGLLAGQVLQRGPKQTATALVQGACATTGKVAAMITQGGKFLKGWRNRTVGAAHGKKFSAMLAKIPVGGPYTITMRVGRESAVVGRIRVGDVWLLAGQSNMQGCGLLREAPSPHPQVHAMYSDGHWDVAREPIHFPASSPDKAHWSAYGGKAPPTQAQQRKIRKEPRGVGPALFFGREMARRSGGVPQGFLCTALGGTKMEQWSPAKKNLGGDSLYGSMLRVWRETGQPIAGVLWYQGESDAPSKTAAARYTARMKQFVAALRRDLKQPKVPFLSVQIGRVFHKENDPNEGFPFWNGIQDQQLRLKKHIRNLDVVAAVDLPLDDRIHIGTAGQARLGVRLARLADRMVYGHRGESPAPEVVSIRRAPTSDSKKMGVYRVEVKFKNVVGGLRGGPVPAGFALIDPKQKDTRSVHKIALRGNKAYLEAQQRQGDAALHVAYGHGHSPYCNITDARDMPVPVFGPRPVRQN